MQTDYKVIDVVLAVTYRCNSRCIMCNIWKKKDHAGEFQPQHLRNLLSTVRHLNLTGGEPFLRTDIVEIIQEGIKTCPQAQVIISTNGFLTDLIVKKMKEIMTFYPQIGLRVSIDAIGQKHDQTRGIPHAYNLAINTLKELKKIGVKNLGIGHTILDENAGEARKIYQLSRELKVELSIALAQNSEFFFEKTDNVIKNFDNLQKELEFLTREELKTFSPKRWARAYFNYGAWRFFRYRERILAEGSGKDSVFIDPKGNVYPADYVNEIIGNIKENTLDRIINSPQAQKARTTICRDNPYEAWMICTLRGSFAKNKGKILWWALKNKLKVHLGQQILS